MFPLKKYKYSIPVTPSTEPGAFGAVRKHDIHTGVDLYCKEGTLVRAMVDGYVSAIIPFTGPHAESSWWEETFAILVYSSIHDKTILYGEIRPHACIRKNFFIPEGTILGEVKRVLKKDKGIVPSTSMLHMELYNGEVKDCVWWKLGDSGPENLLDITYLLTQELKGHDDI